jgi:hypothetical protein
MSERGQVYPTPRPYTPRFFIALEAVLCTRHDLSKPAVSGSRAARLENKDGRDE